EVCHAAYDLRPARGGALQAPHRADHAYPVDRVPVEGQGEAALGPVTQLPLLLGEATRPPADVVAVRLPVAVPEELAEQLLAAVLRDVAARALVRWPGLVRRGVQADELPVVRLVAADVLGPGEAAPAVVGDDQAGDRERLGPAQAVLDA